mgnify:CR=1 FL=1
MEGTNKAHENGEAMGFVGVRLTAQLGDGIWFLIAVVACIPGSGMQDSKFLVAEAVHR